jgi:hypothetical protein
MTHNTDEYTLVCAYNTHTDCPGRDEGGICTCLCHFMNTGDRFRIDGVSFIKTGRESVRRLTEKERLQ